MIIKFVVPCCSTSRIEIHSPLDDCRLQKQELVPFFVVVAAKVIDPCECIDILWTNWLWIDRDDCDNLPSCVTVRERWQWQGQLKFWQYVVACSGGDIFFVVASSLTNDERIKPNRKVFTVIPNRNNIAIFSINYYSSEIREEIHQHLFDVHSVCWWRACIIIVWDREKEHDTPCMYMSTHSSIVSRRQKNKLQSCVWYWFLILKNVLNYWWSGERKESILRLQCRMGRCCPGCIF